MKPPRPEILSALREPDSASGLAVRLGQPRQRLSHLGDGVPALAVPAHVRFSSPAAFNDFVGELTEAVERLLAKYHDESAAERGHRFFLGAYPAVPADAETGG